MVNFCNGGIMKYLVFLMVSMLVIGCSTNSDSEKEDGKNENNKKQGETKPKTKPEAKPKTKPKTRPENKPKPENKPESKPGTKPEAKQENNQEPVADKGSDDFVVLPSMYMKLQPRKTCVYCNRSFLVKDHIIKRI